MKKVSFIVPVYNVEKYLIQCIESIINLKHIEKEIILVNDGSTDKSKEICEKLEGKYNTIKLFNKLNGGLSDARNLGIKNATGDYIAFIDSDDFYSYDFSKEINLLLESSDYDLILFNLEYYYDKTGTKTQPKRNLNNEMFQQIDGIDNLEKILNAEPMYSWHAVQGFFKRKVLVEKELYFVKGRNYEDMLWLPEVLLETKKICYMNKVCYSYRLERKGQITRTYSKKNFEDSLFVLNYWDKKTEEISISFNLKKLMMSNFINRYYYCIIYLYHLDRYERKHISKLLRDNNKFLLVQSSLKNKIILIMYKTLGLKLTSLILFLFTKIR